MTATSIAEVVLRLDCISRVNEQLEGENAALRAAISAIQDLHAISRVNYLDPNPDPDNCCRECLYEWPCPTITAIGNL